MQYVTLPNGLKMPQLGYGVYQVTKEECERCVLDALKVGYRHIDTAQAYQNEAEVGSAIIKSGIPRKDVFITTKVWITNYGYEQTKKSVEESLRNLQTDYIDLMLLHQPFGDYYGAWKALEELYDQKKLKAIGISNFYPDRMIDLCSFSRIKPMVNQIELHPFDQQIEAQKWMQKYNVVTEAWAPFAEGKGGLFTNPTIAEIGKKYQKSVAQVVLRWEIQRGIVVIPKSVHADRMKQNFEVFDFKLTDEDMNVIAGLDQQKSSFFSHQDPNTVEWFMEIIGKKKKE
ncbi:hypothetical protein M9Y10_028324 [Tritrichomonas musculus]|uniref:NADP-dependent oxidoreductase domain-containing protein n=1 Tax=Tritrichomonas musculus TaxID=1915356 RepID=A0ABR2KJ00_9EUKA